MFAANELLFLCSVLIFECRNRCSWRDGSPFLCVL